MLRSLLVTTFILIACILYTYVLFAVETRSYRYDSHLTLNATPQAIGSGANRSELRFRNSGSNDMLCGRIAASLSETPGPNSGERYKAGEGIVECVFADKELHCISSSGTEISFGEARIVTATPTDTPTATPTATITNTPS